MIQFNDMVFFQYLFELYLYNNTSGKSNSDTMVDLYSIVALCKVQTSSDMTFKFSQ